MPLDLGLRILSSWGSSGPLWRTDGQTSCGPRGRLRAGSTISVSYSLCDFGQLSVCLFLEQQQ